MITVGQGRRMKQTEHNDERFSCAGEIMTSAGLGLMAALLIGFMPPDAGNSRADDAVYVMSTHDASVSDTAVSGDGRDELVMPEKSASAAGEVSFFELIGEFFAEMIFGEG